MKKIVQLFFCSLVVSSSYAKPDFIDRLRDCAASIAVIEIPYVGEGIKRLDDGIMKVAPDNEIAQGVAKAFVASHMPVNVAGLNLPFFAYAVIFQKDCVPFLFPTGKTVVSFAKKFCSKSFSKEVSERLAFFKILGSANNTAQTKLGKTFPLFQHGFAIAFLNGEISKDSVLNYASSITNNEGAGKLINSLFDKSSNEKYWSGFAGEGIVSGLTAIAKNKNTSIKNRFWACSSLLGLQGFCVVKMVAESLKDSGPRANIDNVGIAVKGTTVAFALVKSAKDLFDLYKEYKENKVK